MKEQILVYSVSRLISSPEIVKILQKHNSKAWAYTKTSIAKLFSTALMYSPRRGIDTELFKQGNDKITGYSMPDYDENFNKTFSDVSDQSALDLLTKLPYNKKLIVNWSGGIDSTVALSAILKNWPTADLERVEVGLNQTSIFENPYFYYKFLENRITVRNSNNTVDFDKYFVVVGEPDLFLSSKYIDTINEFPIHKSINAGASQYIDYLSKKVNKQFANVHYEKLIENINSVDIPIETIADLIWWEGFNYQWKGRIGQEYFTTPNMEYNFDTFINSRIYWYSNENYQKWAMINRGHGQTNSASVPKIKTAHKKYIYDFDKNHFYYNFKSKFPSASRYGYNQDNNVCAVTQNYRTLTIEKDLDEIQQLIHKILN